MNELGPWTSSLAQSSARGTLLLVEDDPVDMVRLRDYFTTQGYRVVAVQPIADWERSKTDWKQVNSLSEMRSLIATTQPDHVLTDLHYGDAPFNGQAVVAIAKDLVPDAPIVLHSGSIVARRAEDGYTAMPKQASQLAQIDRLLQGPGLQASR